MATTLLSSHKETFLLKTSHNSGGSKGFYWNGNQSVHLEKDRRRLKQEKGMLVTAKLAIEQQDKGGLPLFPAAWWGLYSCIE